MVLNLFLIFQSDSDVMTSIYVALESIHAALAIMAYADMPKQLYKEEVCTFYLKQLKPIIIHKQWFLQHLLMIWTCHGFKYYM